MVSLRVTKEQFSVDQIQRLSLMFPDPHGSFNYMKRTYSILFSVTKKTVQKIYIQDLLQRGLQTKNIEFVVKKMIRHSKSEVFRSEKNVKELNRTLMMAVLMDAAADLDETNSLAGKKMKSLFKYARNALSVGSFRLFKEHFFELLRSTREAIWSEGRRKNKRAVSFRYNKMRNVCQRDTQEVPQDQHSNAKNTVQVVLPEDHPQELKGFMNSVTLQKIGIALETSRFEAAGSQNPNVFGPIDLTGDEVEALKLHPKMRLFEKLKMRDMELEIEKGLTIIRWGEKRSQVIVQRNQVQESITHNNLPFQCGSSDRPISAETSIYFPSVKVTDLTTNRYVKLPDPLHSSEETKLLSFKTEMMETFRKYVDQNCTSDGAQSWNISLQQKAGLITLKKRIQEEDLVAMESDKSKRMTLSRTILIQRILTRLKIELFQWRISTTWRGH